MIKILGKEKLRTIDTSIYLKNSSRINELIHDLVLLDIDAEIIINEPIEVNAKLDINTAYLLGLEKIGENKYKIVGK